MIVKYPSTAQRAKKFWHLGRCYNTKGQYIRYKISPRCWQRCQNFWHAAVKYKETHTNQRYLLPTIIIPSIAQRALTTYK